ncbi:MAG: endonuclease domain-containing protein [Coriobacteriales bacterium]|nr:endonuclease domain-containing protein [Coriobacteriales bacterium]
MADQYVVSEGLAEQVLTAKTAKVTQQALAQKARRGKLLRLTHGAYVDAAEFAAQDFSGQYRLRAAAYLLTHPDLRPWGITTAALAGAPVLTSSKLHFAADEPLYLKRTSDLVLHEGLGDAARGCRPEAVTLYECAVSASLGETLLAAAHLLHELLLGERGITRSASYELDGDITEALVRLPLDAETSQYTAPAAVDLKGLEPGARGFIKSYTAMRQTRLASTAAELLWCEYANLCSAIGQRRGFRQALLAGLYFSDQQDSPAETLLLARCVELGFKAPLLQVGIQHPGTGQLLGRVDGLWPTASLQRSLRYADTQHGQLLFSNAKNGGGSLVVEFDGRQKYGQNAEDYLATLEAERLRQNSITNLGYRFVRLSWEDLVQPDALAATLSSAGVPRR